MSSVDYPLIIDLLSSVHTSNSDVDTIALGSIQGCSPATLKQATRLLSELLTKEHVAKYGEIARIECILKRSSSSDDTSTLTGMVIYTSGTGTTRPVVHFADALLTPGNECSAFSAAILHECGVSRTAIAQIEENVSNDDYCAVISREATEYIGGRHVAQPQSPPVKHWKILRVSKCKQASQQSAV